MEKDTQVAIVSEESIRDKMYNIRGQKVMLDFELAEIYGYETKSFNRQVKNNSVKFEGDDFMFQLTKDEWENLRCKKFTSSWGGLRYLPMAFTEQGIYMLMTVLRGELAIKQSRALVRTDECRVFHCGASSKDAGARITSINEIFTVQMYDVMIEGLLNNSNLLLK